MKNKYETFYNKHGYYPRYFVPYNCLEIKNYTPTLTANSNTSPTHAGTVLIIEPVCVALRGRYDEDRKINQQLELRHDGLTNTITTVTKDNLIIESK